MNLGPVEVRGRLLAAEEEIEQIVVGKLHQQRQAVGLRLRDGVGAGEETLDEQVVLEHAAPAAPAQLAQGARVDRVMRLRVRIHGAKASHQTARLTISSLILPMARVGFRPFGQTSTQFMIVWQRNRRYGSSRLSRRVAGA